MTMPDGSLASPPPKNAAAEPNGQLSEAVKVAVDDGSYCAIM